MDKIGGMKALKESLKGIQERLTSSRQEVAAIIGDMEYVNAGFDERYAQDKVVSADGCIEEAVFYVGRAAEALEDAIERLEDN